jgi:hypothetical protein
MLGPNAHAEIISVAFAGKGQHQDAGAKAVHIAPNTTSRITSKSISKDSGRTTLKISTGFDVLRQSQSMVFLPIFLFQYFSSALLTSSEPFLVLEIHTLNTLSLASHS